MRRVVIESPLRAENEEQAALFRAYLGACIADSLARGESPYASHGLLVLVLDDEDAIERRIGMGAGFAWHAVADAIVVYIDLGISDGMREGIEHARQLGRPVEYRELGPKWPQSRARGLPSNEQPKTESDETAPPPASQPGLGESGETFAARTERVAGQLVERFGSSTLPSSVVAEQISEELWKEFREAERK